MQRKIGADFFIGADFMLWRSRGDSNARPTA